MDFFLELKSECLTRYLEMTEGCGVTSIKMRRELHQLLNSPEPDAKSEAAAEELLQRADPHTVFPMHDGSVDLIRQWLENTGRCQWADVLCGTGYHNSK